MEKKSRFLIYDRKEIGILLLLSVMVTLFAFTLGVHLGKKTSDEQKKVMEDVKEQEKVEQADEKLPKKTALAEKKDKADAEAEEALERDLQNEVAKTGIQVEEKQPTKLPEKSKSQGQPNKKGDEEETSLEQQKSAAPALERDAPAGGFTIQVGSYPKLQKAQKRVKELQKQGYEPFVRKADLDNIGEWFRIYIGGYESQKKAREKGISLKNEGVIDSFLVVNMPDS